MKRCGEDKSFYSKLKTRMKKETLSFCFFFFIVIGIAFFSKSYALFQKQIKTADVNLKVGELEYKIECRECTDSQIELLPNSSKELTPLANALISVPLIAPPLIVSNLS